MCYREIEFTENMFQNLNEYEVVRVGVLVFGLMTAFDPICKILQNNSGQVKYILVI